MIDIVMTYHNRLGQLRCMLDSIRNQKHDDVRIIIVDDASESSLAATLILNQFQDINIKVITVKIEEKTWINPSIPYNKGFSEATAEHIIIQNPECVHKGPVLETVRKQLVEGRYITFPCYSLGMKETEHFLKEGFKKPFNEKNWYNHPKHHPTNLHFCSAITLNDLNRVGGFNPIFADGYCFDDNEFLWRIKKKGIHVNCMHPSAGAMVFHLWHTKQRLGCCPEWHKNHERYLKIING